MPLRLLLPWTLTLALLLSVDLVTPAGFCSHAASAIFRPCSSQIYPMSVCLREKTHTHLTELSAQRLPVPRILRVDISGVALPCSGPSNSNNRRQSKRLQIVFCPHLAPADIRLTVRPCRQCFPHPEIPFVVPRQSTQIPRHPAGALEVSHLAFFSPILLLLLFLFSAVSP